jgi:hypothetical protein
MPITIELPHYSGFPGLFYFTSALFSNLAYYFILAVFISRVWAGIAQSV